MKKITIYLLSLTIIASFITTITLFAKSDTNSESYWFNIKITDMKTNKERLVIKVPLSVIEWAGQFLKDNDKHHIDFDLEEHCDVDLKKLIEILKTSRDKFLIKVENFEENERIEIWIE